MSNSMSSPAHRMSTPEASQVSSLRPPNSSRAIANNSHLRASADMANLSGSSPSSRLRPSSDFYGQQGQGQGAGEMDAQDKLAQQWIADIDQYENTLEEMAEATLDQDFKDELSAIEQWFRVLSEAERTAASYALLQQTSPVQIRFFIQVLQQMDKNHPMSSVLSPANFDKDPMSSRLTDAIGKLDVGGSARNSMARNSVAGKRQSGLDTTTINAMFPDAAAAIATVKANYTSQHGTLPPSTRNSLAVPDGEGTVPAPASPWGQGDRPKSSSTQAPMGQFAKPPPSAGLRSPRPNITGNNQIQSQTVTAGDAQAGDMPLSPYATSGNWASMVNTPMVPNFQGQPMSKELANATAMKLAAVSTVNSRFALDDVRKFRRARSSDGPGNPLSPGVPGVGLPVMLNDRAQILSPEQVMALQAQQQMHLNAQRPRSPGIGMQGGFAGMPMTSPHNNGFLTSPLNGMGMGQLGGMNLATLGLPGHHEGYLSDHSDINRGRSPRGRRGQSKPPEDPTDISLLQDIPAWLRSLRLHKYTDNLKDLKWTDLVELSDSDLEKRGVNALGARNKMLKTFAEVKQAKETGKL